MGRPLRKDKIEKMELSVSTFDGETKTLGKQVGYNKYIVDEETKEIVTLVEKLEKEGDALLLLEDNSIEYPVVKIVRNIIQTPEKVYPYTCDEDGKIVFLDDNVTIYDVHVDVETIDDIENELAEKGEANVEIKNDIHLTATHPLNVAENQTLTLVVNSEEANIGKDGFNVDGGTANITLNGATNISSNGVNVTNGGNITMTLNNDITTNYESFVVDGGSLTIDGGNE